MAAGEQFRRIVNDAALDDAMEPRDVAYVHHRLGLESADMIELRLRNQDRIMSPTIFMRRCLELAEIAARAGDTAVGSVIVRGDGIVGEGVERTRAARDPSAHAEVEAIRQACQHLDTLDLSGCTLYSTVEPCVLCGYAIRRTGIAHVVYGVPAGQAGACTSSYAILADRDLEGWPQVPEVTAGVLADECLAALRRTKPMNRTS